MARKVMVCRELVELITLYLEDALSLPERERFEAHLLTCGGCTTYLNQIKESARLTSRTGWTEAVSPETKDTLMRAFRDWHETDARLDGQSA